MGGAPKELHQKCYDCIELMELDPKSSLMIRSIQQVLCILTVFNTSTNKIQCSLMINCALKNKQKVGLNKCYPYDLLELSYLKGRPDCCLNITLSDTSSINRPCCVIPKIETAEHNFSSDKNKCKNLQFWLLTLQNIDRNSWQRISSGIENLNSTGEFIISSGRIATSEKGRERLTTSCTMKMLAMIYQ